MRAQTRRWLRRPEFVKPLTQGPRPFSVAVFDIETKKDDGQEMGFDRPFLVVLREANGDHHVFRDSVRRGHWQEWSIQPGGCIDKALEYLLSEPRFAANQRAYKKRDGTRVVIPPTYLYGHNAGNFDMNHLIRWLLLPKNRRRFDCEIIPIQGSIVQMTVYPVVDTHTQSTERKRGKWKYVFRDSAKLLPGKLDEVAKAFGVPPKLPMDLSADENDPRWEAYCLQDCTAVHDIVTTFVREIEIMGGTLGVTLPSTAMRLFRAKYLDKPFPRYSHFPWCSDLCPVCHREKCREDCQGAEAQAEKRKRPPQCPTWPMGCHHAFCEGFHPQCGEHAGGHRHGGRTEVFITRCDEHLLRYYDRNSSYPASMCQPMPVYLEHAYNEDLTFEHMADLTKMGLIGFVECVVEIPDTCEIPPLGVVRDDKLVFPVGTFFGRFPWCELKHLRDPLVQGRIVRTFRSTWFSGKPIFEPMMRLLYETRARDKKSARGNACKLILNSLYGKCAQNPVRDHCVSHVPGSAIPDNWRPTNPRCEDPKEWPLGFVEVYQEAEYFLPHIASWITGLSREALWLVMRDLVAKRRDVFMCDTDSVVTDGTMPSSNELGDWKEEHPGILLAGEFPAPKFYKLIAEKPFEGHHELNESGGRLCDATCKGCSRAIVHMKGVPRHQHTPKSFAFFLDGGTLTSFKPPKFGTLARRGYDKYETQEHKKSRRTQYDKRKLLANHRTAPLDFTEQTRFPWDDGRMITCELLLKGGLP